MRTVFFLVAAVLLCGAGAFGQASVGPSAETHMLVMNEHPQRAAAAAMATEQNLLERSTATSVVGERPMWEVMKLQFVSLGDVAREIRKEHETAKKAVKVWVN